jgi:DNA-binding protein YbaB
MIADLFTAAVNQSIDTVKKEKETRLSKVVGKMGGMPGLF